ncbi:MAG: hypothetical protein ABH841_02285 [Candidatus Nealsonbacteria bacterium]
MIQMQETIIAGQWLCSCGLWFSWSSSRQLAVYSVINSKTGKLIKIKKSVCQGSNSPLMCPECGGHELIRMNA